MKSSTFQKIATEKPETAGFEQPVKINYLVTVVSNLMAFGGSKRNMERYGLTITQLRILGLLWQIGPMTLSDISETIHHDRSTLSRSAAGMEKDGIIKREPNRRHKSSPYLCLTDKGNALIEEINPEYRERARKLTAVLSDDEKKQLAELLEKLKDHMEDLKAFEDLD